MPQREINSNVEILWLFQMEFIELVASVRKFIDNKFYFY